jgi:hypothetical protein
MVDREYLNRDIKTARNDIKQLKKDIVEFPEIDQVVEIARGAQIPFSEDLHDFTLRADELCGRIDEILISLVENHYERDIIAQACHLATSGHALEAELNWLQTVLTRVDDYDFQEPVLFPSHLTQEIRPPVSKAVTKVKNVLMPRLKRLLSKVWQIISGLLTPKEWKIQGKVGTGLLGLADVGIEITFGP